MAAKEQLKPKPLLERAWFVALLYSGILLLLFYPSLSSNQILVSNDGPLGMLEAHAPYPWAGFNGYWMDQYWLGKEMPAPIPNVSQGLFMLMGPALFGQMGPVLYLKFSLPITLLLLAMSGWWCFRQFRFHPAVCLLGGIAAMLNMNSFSNGCWGLSSWCATKAMIFLAMGLLASPQIRKWWIKLPLAGFAVGIGITEGFDTGAIFSLYLAAFALAYELVSGGIDNAKSWLLGIGKVAAIAACAAFLSVHTLKTLVDTQITGISGMEEKVKGKEVSKEEKERQWTYATQWSLPKAETVRLLIPGVYGYRERNAENRPTKQSYWGRVGEYPGAPGTSFSGSGEYAGVLVLLLGLWALLQSFRRESLYSRQEKWMIWFWSGLAFVSLLLAWGRFFPVYSFIYPLPFFNTIRNPIKFTQPMHLALVVLFAYGAQDLWRRHVLARETAGGARLIDRIVQWWKEGATFDKGWMIGMIVLGGVSLLCWGLYIVSIGDVVAYLQKTKFQGNEQLANDIATFSIVEVGWYLFFLLATVVPLFLILLGVFRGPRSKWALVVLGLVLTLDLARANKPWITYLDYKARYASDAIVDRLRQEPYKHRVGMFYLGIGQGEAQQVLEMLGTFDHNEWVQHQFPYYQVHTMDIPQEPRVPAIKQQYKQALYAYPLRYWQYTSTRYILGIYGLADGLNNQFDPGPRRFKELEKFTLDPRPGSRVLVETNDTGPFALIEFTGALPRAALYQNWEVFADNAQALERMKGADFVPETTIVVSGEPGLAPASGATNRVGTVTYDDYAPKRIRLSADVAAPSILMLNDQWHPGWKAFVDGQPAHILKCNFLVRGLKLEPGHHAVEFRFEPASRVVYVSLLAIAIALGMLGYVVFQVQTGRMVAPPDDEPDSGKDAPSPAPSAKASEEDKDSKAGKKKGGR